MPDATPPRIAIIGAGFGGVCVAIQLAKAGIRSFTLYEKAPRLGGTWRDNTYPGAACDSPSFAYCYSFEQKTDWTRKWSGQAEILGYLEQCAEKWGLGKHLRLGTEIASSRFDEERSVWTLRTTAGEEILAEVLVSCVGQLNRPALPDIAGLERFRGPCFHSARWDHTVPLAGKRVAVIGNAASAIQFIPELAKEVSQLFVFQRSANWMLPRFDRAYSETTKRIFTCFPWLARVYRSWIWAMFELRWPLFRGNQWLARRVQRYALAHLEEEIPDPELRRKLVPDYPVGGKRILISDDYYQTLRKPHVELVTDGIDHLSEDAVVTSQGRAIAVDAVVLATGFQTTDFLAPMHIEGKGARLLEEDWQDGPRSYLGISVAGYPNFFMTYGPNTNLGHNSIIFMIECQTRYIVSCIRTLVDRDLASLDVRRDVMEAFDAATQQELAGTVWAATPRSWYKNAAGRITNNWSGSTIRYWWRTRKLHLADFELRARARTAAPAAGSSSRADRPAAAAS
jgi:cation diffusion facilitator CzcD-associated flavoprotein CzcO